MNEGLHNKCIILFMPHSFVSRTFVKGRTTVIQLQLHGTYCTGVLYDDRWAMCLCWNNRKGLIFWSAVRWAEQMCMSLYTHVCVLLLKKEYLKYKQISMWLVTIAEPFML